MYKILIIHGPNLSYLGFREPDIYGKNSIQSINKKIKVYSKKLNLIPTIYLSNSEYKIIRFIHKEAKNHQGILFNFAAFTHTSIALRDCLLIFPHLKKIELHLSNIYKREKFRHHSYFHDIVDGIITGFKNQTYILGLRAMSYLMNSK